MSQTQTLGARGEQIAAAYLRRHGYQILKTNYRVREGEIDIIAQIDAAIIFVEVKTRTNKSFGEPEDAVGRYKLARIFAAAMHYLHACRPGHDWQIDVISIMADPVAGSAQIRHLKNVGV